MARAAEEAARAPQGDGYYFVLASGRASERRSRRRYAASWHQPLSVHDSDRKHGDRHALVRECEHDRDLMEQRRDPERSLNRHRKREHDREP